MNMIPPVIQENDFFLIPIYYDKGYCYLEWQDDDCMNTMLKKMKITKFMGYKIYPPDIDPDDENSYMQCEEIYIYEVKCAKFGTQYFMISFYELFDYSHIFHCVCIPYNALNILKFFSDYTGKIGQAKFRLE